MVTIYVFYQVQTVGLEKSHNFSLLTWSVLDEFYCFLNHSAAVTILWKWQQVSFYYFKKSLLLFFFSSFKNLLENVVAKFVFREFDTFLNQCFKDCLLCVWFTVLNDELHRSGTVLIPSPVSCLFKVIENLFFRSLSWEVVRCGNTDRAIAAVLFFGLQTQSELSSVLLAIIIWRRGYLFFWFFVQRFDKTVLIEFWITLSDFLQKILIELG